MEKNIIDLENKQVEEDNTTYASYKRPIYLTSPQMYGEDVKEVQRRLNALNYNAGTVDGYFGPDGDKAVRAFQGKNGLAVDGSVGPATWNKLFSSSAIPNTSSGYKRPIYLTSPQMYGEDVKEVQRRLNALNYNAGTVDGYFGPSGDSAVRDFQGVNGLAVDGSVGPATWNKLFSSSAISKPSGSTSGYKYDVVKVNGYTFHIIEANLDRIETETILKPIANTSYVGINGGFFDSDSYFETPKSGSSICYNYKDVGQYTTVGSVRRIKNFHENQISDKAVDQRTLTIYRAGGGVTYRIDNMKHVNTAFNNVGESNVLNVIGGYSPELTSGSNALSLNRAAISINGRKAYLIYSASRISQSKFNEALNTGLGRGLTRSRTVMMDGSGSACMKNTSGFIGTERRHLYNIIRVIM